jgi:hypothetical protein
MEVAYTPGAWVAVIGQRIWALIDSKVDDPRLPALWGASDAGIDELLDVLVRSGLRSLPGFAIVALDSEALRYAVRHPGVLTIQQAGSEQRIDGADGDPWVGGRLPGSLARVVLAGDPKPSNVELPTAAGVASASRLLVSFGAMVRTQVVNAQAQPILKGESEAAPDTHDLNPAAVGSRLTGGDSTPAAVWMKAGESDTDREPQPENLRVESHASTYLQLLNSSTMERDALISKLRADDTDEHQDASVAHPQAPKLASDATSIWSNDQEERPHDLDEQPRVTAGTPPDTSGMIDGLPWASRSDPSLPEKPALPGQSPMHFTPVPAPTPQADSQLAATPPAPPDCEVPVGDTNEMSVTISRTALRRQLEAEKAPGPTLLALRCELEHLSPPYAVNCRVCGAEFGDQDPIEVVRPALGELVLSNGSSVVLDKGVVFGRSPHSDIEDAAQRPNLVRLIDSAEISRMHASVMLDGWQVLLRDLGSQNGTILTLPGRAPEQIRPHEDYVLEPGSVVSFADVVSCKFEVSA